MQHNFSANRLNKYVEFLNQVDVVDDYGKPSKVDESSFDCWADVDEKSATQLTQMGKATTESVITVLTYFHPAVKSSQVVRYNGGRYEVDGIQLDSNNKAMIVSCTRIGEQSFEDLQ